jgi:hypothetical protein
MFTNTNLRFTKSVKIQTPAEVYLTGKNIVQPSQVEIEDSTLF